MQEIFLKISWLEWLGVILAIIQVILSRSNNSLNYLFGIGGVLITLVVMFESKLYAEFSLNIYYLVMSIYGWFFWKYGKAKEETQISHATKKEYTIAGLISFISFLLFYISLQKFTDSDVPLWDSLVSAFAWAGMWLMAKRKIENWIFLNVSNILSIPLMIHKSLYLYAILSVILFIVAISGYINWKKIIKQKNLTSL